VKALRSNQQIENGPLQNNSLCHVCNLLAHRSFKKVWAIKENEDRKNFQDHRPPVLIPFPIIVERK
jgi:hypothetical protein